MVDFSLLFGQSVSLRIRTIALDLTRNLGSIVVEKKLKIYKHMYKKGKVLKEEEEEEK